MAPPPHAVETAREANALASPIRLEVVDALRHLRPSAVGEVARYLVRAKGPLYHHVRVLHEAGVIARSRPAGGQQ